MREFIEIGYDRLSVDRLVEFGIHGVTPRYIKALAELGYDDISPGRLIEMKIHGVTASFIRRAISSVGHAGKDNPDGGK